MQAPYRPDPPAATPGLRTLGTGATQAARGWACDLPGDVYGVKQVVTVILYHSIALASLQADLDKFQEWNFTTITPDDLYDYLTGVRSALPAKPLLITFDDGNLTNYTSSYPELLTRGMKATFYVVVNWLDDVITGASFGAAEGSHFTWANAQTMFANGMRIQSHTMNHVPLTGLSSSAILSDWTAAKARIEAMVPGETVRHIAYPYGVCSEDGITALEGAGVRSGRTVTNDYLNVSSGRMAYVTPNIPRLKVPTAGTNYNDIAQASFYNRLSAEPELVPDFGFKGGGKGWALATGASMDAGTLRPGAPAGTKSLKQVQQSSSVSSSNPSPIYVGQWGRLVASMWIKTDQLGGVGRAFPYLITVRPDAVTQYALVNNYITTVPATQDWTLYSWSVFLDHNVLFVRMGLQVTGQASPLGTAWFAEPSLHQINDTGFIF